MGTEPLIPSRNRIMMSLVDVRLIPFYLSVCAYFILYEPYLHYPNETVDAAIVKAIPIWSLALFVHKTKESQKTDYSHMFVCALGLSSLGDMCLIWRDAMFIPGMLFFAAAHVCYLLGLAKDFNFKTSRTGVLFTLLGTCVYLFLADGIKSWLMKVLVFIYEILIFGVTWLAFEHFLFTSTSWSFFGASGSALFVFSDLLIGVNKWKVYIPLSEVLIMTTYYAGQLCLALSTVKE